MAWVGYAEQYGTPSVVIEQGDEDPEEIIELAEENGAVLEADDHYLVVRFPGRPDEVYTERALRGSFPIPATT